jgi:hypothetical protein
MEEREQIRTPKSSPKGGCYAELSGRRWDVDITDLDLWAGGGILQ